VILGLEIVAAAMLMFTVLSPNTTMLMISLVLYGLLGKMAVDPILILVSFPSRHQRKH
jgi:hypothetical protein